MLLTTQMLSRGMLGGQGEGTGKEAQELVQKEKDEQEESLGANC